MGYNIIKTPKGEISVDNHQKRIRLRWRYNGERYSLNLPLAYTPENLAFANVKVAEIKLDILKGCFDSSLVRYKPPARTKVIAQEPPKDASASPVAATPFLNSLIPKFNEWVSHIKNVDIENSTHYLYVRKLLEKWVDIPVDKVAELLNGETWAVTTYNRRLYHLNNFFGWLVGLGIVSQNPLADVCRKRDKKKKKNPRRVPLSEDEILKFLDAIKKNTYCPSSSRFKHSHYYAFLAFIFYTGVRNAEAIGLRVRHIDLVKGHIEISEVLARTLKGTNHAARVRKGTKTENVRYLPLTDGLRELLTPLIEGKGPEDLVFLSPRGLSINDQMLEKRTLKPVMKALGLGNRDLYAARHSFGTRAVQQGMVLTDVAYLMGHSTIETAVRNYVAVAKPATMLPKIKDKRGD